jgi:hypothetical protein
MDHEGRFSKESTHYSDLLAGIRRDLVLGSCSI